MRIKIGLFYLSASARRAELFVDDLDRRVKRSGWRTILANTVEGRRRRGRWLQGGWEGKFHTVTLLRAWNDCATTAPRQPYERGNVQCEVARPTFVQGKSRETGVLASGCWLGYPDRQLCGGKAVEGEVG